MRDFDYEYSDGFTLFDPTTNPIKSDIERIGDIVVKMGVDMAYKYCNGRRDEFMVDGAIDVLETAKSDLEKFRINSRLDTPAQINRIMYILEHVHDDGFMETNDDTEYFLDIVCMMSTKAIMKAVSEVYGIEYRILLHQAEECFLNTSFWVA